MLKSALRDTVSPMCFSRFIKSSFLSPTSNTFASQKDFLCYEPKPLLDMK